MATPAQAAAATVGAGSLAAAGAYGVTQAVKGNEETENANENEQEQKTRKVSEPEGKDLLTTKNNTYPEKTLGHKAENKNKLIDPKETSNQDWWKESFNTKLAKAKTDQTPLNSLFSNLDKWFEEITDSPDSEIKSLNKACHKAYSMFWYDFTSENNLLANVKLFCSKAQNEENLQEPEENQPTKLTLLNEQDKITEDPYKDKYSVKDNNKTNLVAALPKTTDKENEIWWKWTYKKHFLNQKATNKSEIDTPFASVTSAYSTSAVSSPGPQTALNQACDAVYKQTVGTSDTKLQKNIISFCSKSKAESSITFTN